MAERERERTELDRDLTLSKDITMAWQAEDRTKRQQSDVRGDLSNNETLVDAVHFKKGKQHNHKNRCFDRTMDGWYQQHLGQAKHFTKLDGKMGFRWIPLSKESALDTKRLVWLHHLCAITEISCLLECSKHPEHFQSMMVTEVTAGLEGAVCYMDDILIWSTTKQQHDARVHAVLTLNTVKSPDPDKTRAMQQWRSPRMWTSSEVF